MTPDSLLQMRKFLAPEFVFGPGSSDLVGRYAQNLGGPKALVVSDPGVAAAGWTAKVVANLRAAGLSVVEFLDVSPNPRDSQIMEGSAIYAREGCGMLVAVGGGSPMDCAKGIGIVHTNERHILSFAGADNVPLPGPPLICIPTTAGTSADISQFAIIGDTARKVKIAIVSKALVPDVSLLDPALTGSMPPDLTAHTGLDALTHAMEAYVSNASSPMTDLLALEAIRQVAANLPQAYARPHDLTARAGMLHASLLAGLAFSNAILGAVHAMAHSLGGFLDLPHGQCNAILLDHVARRNFTAAPARYRQIAKALGADIEATPEDRGADVLVQAIRDLKAGVGVTQTLSDLGVAKADIAALAETALRDPCLVTNPAALSRADIEHLFAEAL
jgi:alcohol dehydrogenase class IV